MPTSSTNTPPCPSPVSIAVEQQDTVEQAQPLARQEQDRSENNGLRLPAEARLSAPDDRHISYHSSTLSDYSRPPPSYPGSVYSREARDRRSDENDQQRDVSALSSALLRDRQGRMTNSLVSAESEEHNPFFSLNDINVQAGQNNAGPPPTLVLPEGADRLPVPMVSRQPPTELPSSMGSQMTHTHDGRDVNLLSVSNAFNLSPPSMNGEGSYLNNEARTHNWQNPSPLPPSLRNLSSFPRPTESSHCSRTESSAGSGGSTSPIVGFFVPQNRSNGAATRDQPWQGERPTFLSRLSGRFPSGSSRPHTVLRSSPTSASSSARTSPVLTPVSSASSLSTALRHKHSKKAPMTRFRRRWRLWLALLFLLFLAIGLVAGFLSSQRTRPRNKVLAASTSVSDAVDEQDLSSAFSGNTSDRPPQKGLPSLIGGIPSSSVGKSVSPPTPSTVSVQSSPVSSDSIAVPKNILKMAGGLGSLVGAWYMGSTMRHTGTPTEQPSATTSTTPTEEIPTPAFRPRRHTAASVPRPWPRSARQSGQATPESTRFKSRQPSADFDGSSGSPTRRETEDGVVFDGTRRRSSSTASRTLGRKAGQKPFARSPLARSSLADISAHSSPSMDDGHDVFGDNTRPPVHSPEHVDSDADDESPYYHVLQSYRRSLRGGSEKMAQLRHLHNESMANIAVPPPPLRSIFDGYDLQRVFSSTSSQQAGAAAHLEHPPSFQSGDVLSQSSPMFAMPSSGQGEVHVQIPSLRAPSTTSGNTSPTAHYRRTMSGNTSPTFVQQRPTSGSRSPATRSEHSASSSKSSSGGTWHSVSRRKKGREADLGVSYLERGGPAMTSSSYAGSTSSAPGMSRESSKGDASDDSVHSHEGQETCEVPYNHVKPTMAEASHEARRTSMSSVSQRSSNSNESTPKVRQDAFALSRRASTASMSNSQWSEEDGSTVQGDTLADLHERRSSLATTLEEEQDGFSDGEENAAPIDQELRYMSAFMPASSWSAPAALSQFEVPDVRVSPASRVSSPHHGMDSTVGGPAVALSRIIIPPPIHHGEAAHHGDRNDLLGDRSAGSSSPNHWADAVSPVSAPASEMSFLFSSPHPLHSPIESFPSPGASPSVGLPKQAAAYGPPTELSETLSRQAMVNAAKHAAGSGPAPSLTTTPLNEGANKANSRQSIVSSSQAASSEMQQRYRSWGESTRSSRSSGSSRSRHAGLTFTSDRGSISGSSTRSTASSSPYDNRSMRSMASSSTSLGSPLQQHQVLHPASPKKKHRVGDLRRDSTSSLPCYQKRAEAPLYHASRARASSNVDMLTSDRSAAKGKKKVVPR